MRKVAIDFDGVVAESGDSKRTWLIEKLGVDVPADELSRSSVVEVIGAEAYTRMQAETGFEDTLCVRPVPGALDALEILHNSFELVLVTARCDSKLHWAREWLRSFNIDSCFYDVVSSCGTSKISAGRLRRNDVIIDNDQRHLIEFSEMELFRFGFRIKDHLHPGASISHASDWSEILQHLATFDSEANAGVGN